MLDNYQGLRLFFYIGRATSSSQHDSSQAIDAMWLSEVGRRHLSVGVEVIVELPLPPYWIIHRVTMRNVRGGTNSFGKTLQVYPDRIEEGEGRKVVLNKR